jgi:hypothetical protein
MPLGREFTALPTAPLLFSVIMAPFASRAFRRSSHTLMTVGFSIGGLMQVILYASEWLATGKSVYGRSAVSPDNLCHVLCLFGSCLLWRSWGTATVNVRVASLLRLHTALSWFDKAVLRCVWRTEMPVVSKSTIGQLVFVRRYQRTWGEFILWSRDHAASSSGQESSQVLTAIHANDTQDLRVNWGVSQLESMNSVPSWGCSNVIGCQTTSWYVAAVVFFGRGYTPNWRELYCVGISRQISLIGSHMPFQQLWPSFPVYFCIFCVDEV